MSRQFSASQFHKSKTLNDKYLLGDEIGKGAYGRVYKGVDLQNGDFVAIKQVALDNIPQDDLAGIMQEIDLLKNLNHKNIVKYLGSFKTKSHLYIILEFVENGSLANIIKPTKFGAFPESLVAVYIAQVLEGLVYLHEQGVIHCDIKGANILTTKEGLVKLADFGVATKLTEADVNRASVLGTPYWMAPEVIEMSGVSASSDIWSVGCTVIELLTCVPPYYDLQPMPALFRIVQDDGPPIPDGLSPSITDFLAQCFRKDAKLRPDAKTLLRHSWIRSSRRALQISMESTGGRISNVPEDVSTVVERLIEGVHLDDPMELSTSFSSHDSLHSTHLERDDEGRDAHQDRGADLSRKFVNGAANGRYSQLGTSAQNSGNLGDEGEGDDPAPLGEGAGPARGSLDAHNVNVDARSHLAYNSSLGEREGMGGHSGSGHPLEHKQGKPGSGRKVRGRREDESAATRDQSQQPVMGHRADSRSNRLGGSPVPCNFSQDDLHQFEDTDVDAQITDLVDGCLERGLLGGSDARGVQLGRELKGRMVRRQRRVEAELRSRPNGDPFTAAMDSLDKIESEAGESTPPLQGQDNVTKQVLEVARLLSDMAPQQPEELAVSACQQLVEMCREQPHQASQVLLAHSVVPLADILDVSNSPQVVQGALEIVALLGAHSIEFLENLCMAGLIPAVLVLASAERSKVDIRLQAAAVVHLLCNSSDLALHMFVACRGLPVLVGFLEADTVKNKELVRIGLDGMWRAVQQRCAAPRSDLCRVLVKSGALMRLANILHSLCETSTLPTPLRPRTPDHSRESLGSGNLSSSTTNAGARGAASSSLPLLQQPVALRKRGTATSLLSNDTSQSQDSNTHYGLDDLVHMDRAAGLLLVMARAGEAVKAPMRNLAFLKRLLELTKLTKLTPQILLKVLRCIKQLSADPNALEPLQRADAIRCLVPFLDLQRSPCASDIHSQVLGALYNLCKINRRRQDAAAEAGIVPTLMRLVKEGSPLKQLALPLLCDMAHASRNTREVLRAHRGVELYLALLGDDFWAATALDSLATCLAQDLEQRRVEQRLLKRDALEALVNFFRTASGPSFAHILEPYLKMITRSVRLNSALATSGLTPLLVARLDHQDAIARLTLLKMIKAVYEHHPRPKQLIVEHDLPRKLQQLMEERRDGERSGGQVLVKQMASALLKGLHINTIL